MARTMNELENEASRVLGEVARLDIVRAAVRVNDARIELEAATLDFERVRYGKV